MGRGWRRVKQLLELAICAVEGSEVSCDGESKKKIMCTTYSFLKWKTFFSDSSLKNK